MKLRLIFLVSSIFYIPILFGEVYKTVDEDGNIIFTDRPTTNSEEIKLRELKTTETVKPSSSSSGSTSRGKNKEDFSYKKIFVSSPADGSAIRSNDGNVTISVNSEPPLRSGHQILITMNGKELSKGSGKSVSLTNLDRGTHTVTVSIIDSSSNAIISASSSFSILRASQ
tara:strand:+ start:381 stop:890 length:510 start_codon:yes stop_codon:yes gene_type:complete